MTRDKLDNVLEKFKFAVDDIYAVYLDAFKGFAAIKEQLIVMQQQRLKELTQSLHGGHTFIIHY